MSRKISRRKALIAAEVIDRLVEQKAMKKKEKITLPELSALLRYAAGKA